MRPTYLGATRALLVLLAVLLQTTILPRTGIPLQAVPDLALVVAASAALHRGVWQGALAGLLTGWVIDLTPPAGVPLGVVPLLYAAGCMTAGLLGPWARRGSLAVLTCVALAEAIVGGGGLLTAAVAQGPVDLTAAGWRVLTTVVAAAFLAPPLAALDRSMTRRRLG